MRNFPIIEGASSLDLVFPNMVNQTEKFNTYQHIYQLFSKAYGTEIILQLKSVSALEARRVLDFYNDMLGNLKTFSLPHEMWRHPLIMRLSFESALESCAFRFKEIPKITTQGYDDYNLSIPLVADFDLVRPAFSPPSEFEYAFNIWIQDNIFKGSDLYPFRRQLFYDVKSRLIPELDLVASGLGKKVTFQANFLPPEKRYIDLSLSFPPHYRKTLNYVITAGSTHYTSNSEVSSLDYRNLLKLREAYAPALFENYYIFFDYNLPQEPELTTLSSENLSLFNTLPNAEVINFASVSEFRSDLKYPVLLSGSSINLEEVMATQIDSYLN